MDPTTKLYLANRTIADGHARAREEQLAAIARASRKRATPMSLTPRAVVRRGTAPSFLQRLLPRTSGA